MAGRDCESRRVSLNRRAGGGRWIPIEWSRTRDVAFVPRALAARFARWHDEGRLPDATGVAFVQEAMMSDGLDVVHESLLWKGRTLLHASSRTGRVVTIPWTEYVAGPGRRDVEKLGLSIVAGRADVAEPRHRRQPPGR